MGVLFATECSEKIDEYLTPDPQYARAIDLNQPEVKAVGPAIFDAPFEYNKENYSVTELIYCYLVIEYPKVVMNVDRDLADQLINNFLKLSENMIQTTSKDEALIQDMNRLENL
ncbi:hypothetical protein IID19_04600 [Patescibacteria group bacterium]|nr:hypothetical protein [Patescibacteria group bacterium]